VAKINTLKSGVNLNCIRTKLLPHREHVRRPL